MSEDFWEAHKQEDDRLRVGLAEAIDDVDDLRAQLAVTRQALADLVAEHDRFTINHGTLNDCLRAARFAGLTDEDATRSTCGAPRKTAKDGGGVITTNEAEGGETSRPDPGEPGWRVANCTVSTTLGHASCPGQIKRTDGVIFKCQCPCHGEDTTATCPTCGKTDNFICSDGFHYTRSLKGPTA